MASYIDNIYTGLLVFPFIAALFTFPYALYQYHRLGSVSKYRTLIIYSFILYMLIAFFMVSLPLPDRASTVGNRWQDHLNLIPFKQVWLYWQGRVLSIESIKAYLVSMSLWQLLFNILLTVPFGVYMHYYFELSLKRTILYSFLLSLFYEASQLTALFGIYPGPYRLADVEDLICNTMGGALGYQIAYVFTKLLPSREEIDEKTWIVGHTVSGQRRSFAVLFDSLLSSLLYEFLSGAVIVMYPGISENILYKGINDWTFFCLFSLLQVLVTGGTTFGHAICRMTLTSVEEGKASPWQLIVRYVCLWLFTEVPMIFLSWITDRQFEFMNEYVTLALLVAARLYFFLYFFQQIIRRGANPMPHDRLSGTVYISTKIPEPEPHGEK